MKKRSLVSILNIFALLFATGLVFSPPVGAAESQSVEDIKAYGALDSHAIYADPNPGEVRNGEFNFNLKTVTIKKSYPGTDYILNGSYGSTPSFIGGLQENASGQKRVWLTVYNLDEGTCALVRCKVKSLPTDWKSTLIKGESITSKNEYVTHTDFYSEDISWKIDDEVRWLTVLSPDGDSSLLTVVLKIGSGSWRHFITVRYSAIYPSGLSGGYSSINEPVANNPFNNRIAEFRPTLMETFSGQSAEFGQLYLLGPTGKNRHSYVIRGSVLIASVGLEPQLEGKSEYRLSLGTLSEQIDYSGGKNLAESVVDSISTTAKSYRQSVRDKAKAEAKAKVEGEARAKAAGIPYLLEGNYAPYITFYWQAPSNSKSTWLTRDVVVEKSGDASYFSIIGNFTPAFYLGIQESHNKATGKINRNAIFSAWDTYEGATENNLGPESRPLVGRTTVVSLGNGVTGGNGFGGEGTGVNAFINDFGWKVGDTVRAVVNLRLVTGGTEISAALQINNQEWRYFGTYKYSKSFESLEPGYSFIEDFGATPRVVRAAEFGNTWLESEDLTTTVPITSVWADAFRGGSQNDLNIPYHLISQKKNSTLWAQTGGDEFISKKGLQAVIATPSNFQIPIEARIAALNLVGEKALEYKRSYALSKSQVEAKAAADLKAKQEAEAKAAADLKAKQEAEAKVEAELKAKQEADAKVAADKAAVDLKAKQEAEAKAAAELRAKQEAEAKAAAELKAKQDAAADKAALAKAQSELAAANAALADAQKVNREQAARITSFEEQFKVLSESVATVQNQLSQLNSKLVTALTGLNTANAKIKKICAAKPKPKGC